MNKHVSALLKQSTEERLLAVETIWESIAQDTPSLALSNEQIKIIKERDKKYDAGKMKFYSYDKAINKLKKKHGLGN